MKRGRKPLYDGCSIIGCDGKHQAKGYCRKHLQRHYRGKNVEVNVPVGRPMKDEKKQLLNDLYEVYRNTENEESFAIIGRAIDFVKQQ